ncbi:MAG: V-type ATP synthase subunit F [Anaerolineae bacterium]|nr:V-type ATP synthase subunit F [Anaerolineae bacterium]
MKILVIGHPEAVLGFSLVGVHGQAATSEAEINQALDDALASADVGIILITEDVTRLFEARMGKLQKGGTIPLIVEIPTPQSKHPEQSSLGEMVRQAIGVKV